MQSLFAALLLSLCALTSATVLLESRSANSSCGCDLSNGTASFASDLNVDVIFIVDVSQGMDSDSLIQASSLVDSIIDSLSLDPAFNRWNGSDSNSTYWNMIDFGFAWNNTDNSTFTREIFDILGANLAYGFNNTDNNSTFNRDLFEVLGSSLAYGWNNTDNNGTSTREFFESFVFNAVNAWNNNTDNNSTFNRDLFEVLGSSLAYGWNNTDNNGTSTREFFESFVFNAVNAWNNNTDTNSTFNRDLFEVLGSSLAYGWNNTDNNGTSTREFFESFVFNAVNAWNNNTDTNSTFTRNLFEMFNFMPFGNSRDYSRVGLVTVADSAEIVFDFSSPFNNSTNLTRSAAPHANLHSGIIEALDMFARAPERSSRQMIYVITASNPAPFNPRLIRSQLHSAANLFKANGGTIAVTDVSLTRNMKPALRNLASPGLYNVGLRDDVNVELQKLCEANCS